MAQPQPRDPDPLVEERREPPRPAPTRRRPDRLQESPRRPTRPRPSGIGPKRTKLKEPVRRPGSPRNGSAPAPTGKRSYSDKEREEVAFRIVEAVLGDTRGLKLEDTRDQPAVGADAVDRDKDIWIELKAHGQEAADTLRLEPSEALRAEEKRGKFWLVVVWNLEKPRTPNFVVIPDPLRRLDTYLANGMRLTGVADLAAAKAAAAGNSG